MTGDAFAANLLRESGERGTGPASELLLSLRDQVELPSPPSRHDVWVSMMSAAAVLEQWPGGASMSLLCEQIAEDYEL